MRPPRGSASFAWLRHALCDLRAATVPCAGHALTVLGNDWSWPNARHAAGSMVPLVLTQSGQEVLPSRRRAPHWRGRIHTLLRRHPFLQ